MLKGTVSKVPLKPLGPQFALAKIVQTGKGEGACKPAIPPLSTWDADLTLH